MQQEEPLQEGSHPLQADLGSLSFLQRRCYHQFFEAQVLRRPDAVAVVSEQGQLTYRDLNSRANQLGHILRKLAVGPDTLVGLCMERSLEQIIGILGILKAGGAYVPLDPLYPQERLALILSDARVPIVLAQQKFASNLSEHSASILCLDSDWQRILQESDASPVSAVMADHLAYVIYTSGSTGTPKGTMITHSALVSYTEAACSAYALVPGDRVLQFASINFDASVEEIACSLASGATLVLRSPAMLDSLAGFLRQCAIWAITVQSLPTAYWHELTRSITTEFLPLPPSLRLTIIGGEKARSELTILWQEYAGQQVQLVNSYGPTETTVVATIQYVEKTPADPLEEVPIGQPLSHAQIYLLDQQYQPVPRSTPGEIYIGGAALARGYLQRPELTAARFLPNPFSSEIGTRLYKTGDLARYRADGTLEFVGRVDLQVKIRGYRIEPAEIEATLLHHPSIEDAVVAARARPRPPIPTKLEQGAERNDPEQHLIAYIVPTQEHELDSYVLRSYLIEQLPAYMIPSAFVFLAALPVSPGGKLDSQSLPSPDWSRPVLAAAFSAPRSPAEEMLGEIWSTILGIAPIGIHDNFFELGGHSLAATRMIAAVRHHFHREITLHSLFASPTIAQLASSIEQGSVAEPLQQSIAIPRIARDGYLPLSFSQERVWFIQQLDPGSLAYNTQTLHRLSGILNVAALQRGLNEIVRRHEIFRTTFPEVDGRPVQIIHPVFAVKLPLVDLQRLDKNASEIIAQQLVHEEFSRPFDITRLPLIRWTLLRLAPNDHILILVEHHLVHDGWSANVLLSETLALYEAFSAGKPSPLPELPIQFADFAAWQRQWMEGDVAKTQMAYWKQKLGDSPPSIDLLTDRPHSPQQSFRGATLRTVLPPLMGAELRALSRHEGVTLFMTMLSAFLILLYRYSGQEDLPVGTAIANRRWRETEGLLGMIINNIVLRTQMTGNPTFRELLERVHTVTAEAYAHQDLPFDQVVKAVKPGRDATRNPLFQIMFSFHDPPMPDLKRSHLTVGLDEGISNGFVKFDLDLLVIPRAEQYLGKRPQSGTEEFILVWEYNTDLYNESTIARMKEQYQVLLADIVAHPERHISDLHILPEVEEQQVLQGWNATQQAFPEDTCIHQLFERQVEQIPDAIAVTFEGAFLTYAALNVRANQIAHALRTSGVQPEDIVGLYMDRSLEQISGMLGILKAGGAYLPLDPNYPSERLAFMLHNARVPLLLTVQQLLQAVPADYHGQRICLDKPGAGWQHMPCDNVLHQPHPLNMAYVIYTSGSTGQPKGVMVSHRGLCNHMHWMQTAYLLTSTDRVLQKTPFSFDASVWEFYAPLLAGACLVIARPGGHQETPYLVTTIEREQITILQLVPTVLSNLLQEPEIKTCTSLRYVFCGGEELSIDLQARFFATLSADLCNLYGPTETTIQTVTWLCERGSEQQRVPIGRPIFNTQAYLLDTHLQPVPIGAAGELYIGGEGVTRGYLYQPALTAERFIPNPFVGTSHDESGSYSSSEPGGRLYRTGDVGRYRADGAIEFLRRADEQIKLRGFRVEPGEVENVLKRHPAVREAVVRIHESGPAITQLIAYLVPAQAKSMPDVRELRAYLLQYLPDYMVPSSFVCLEHLPLLPNGKLDQHALLARTHTIASTSTDYVAPQTAVEETLASLWSEILGVERVGTQDNFFELGGHSLLMMSIHSRIRTIFKVELPLRDLYKAPTVAELAALLIKYETTPAQMTKIAELHKKIAAMPASAVRELLQAKQQAAGG